MRRLKAELDATGIRTMIRHHRNGRRAGGAPFARGKLYALLSNPLYAGHIRHKEAVYPGQHAAIVDAALWQAVQERLATNRQVAVTRSDAASPSPLAGKLTDPDGLKMRPTHATRRGRRYRYYISADLVEGSVATGARGWRIPADEIEAALASVIATRFRDPSFASSLFAEGHVGTTEANATICRFKHMVVALDTPLSSEARDLLRALVTQVDLAETTLRATIAFDGLATGAVADHPDVALADVPGFTIDAPIQLARRGAELRVILQGAAGPSPKPDARLIRTLIEARCKVADYLDPMLDLSLGALAGRDDVDQGDLSRSIQLAFLAPDIVRRILDGTQPAAFTAQKLKRIGDLPLDWDEQQALFA